MKSISLKLPAELEAKLAKLSQERNVSRSDLIRDAIEAYLDRDKSARPSCLDLVGDLAGSLEGSPDLATGPQHLEGYGR